jgi:hypothetical protein
VDKLPAVVFQVKPVEVGPRTHGKREFRWPVDLVILTERRGVNIEESLPPVYDFPELVIAELDSHSHLNGTLTDGIQYDEPAISAGDMAFDVIDMGDDSAYVGTIVHTILITTRVGGFSA